MSDFSSWGLHLGRWFHVRIRLHALFVAVCVFALYLSTSQRGTEEPGYGLLACAILFLSVLVHELAHCCAAMRVGGNAEQITLGPLGGLSPLEVPREQHAELITALAGPAANLCIALVCLPTMILAQRDVLDLLNPVSPIGLTDGPWWQASLALVFWTNWLLLLVNLLPAYPFDGARVLRSLLWPAFDERVAVNLTVRASKLTALALCILAWALADVRAAEVLPAWVPLVLLAVAIYFCAQQEVVRTEETQWNEDLFSYDFSQGYTSLERGADAPQRRTDSVRRWLHNRREQRQRRQRSQELDEERQVDEILIRLHESGMQGLSAKERALLNRVSARYRNRQRN